MNTCPNRILLSLGPKARDSLLALGDIAPLAFEEVLAEAGAKVRHVYFPLDGFISLVAVVDGNPDLEVGMIGHEGMLGTSIALGVGTHPVKAVVQGAGRAVRIPVAAFQGELERSPRLRRAVLRYLYVLLCQQSTTAVCLKFHLTAPRLARWLLMTGDRARSPRFRLTQEFLAYMLGVRREGVTQAAGALQQQGLIEYRRGEVHIVDRAGLEAASCGCYAADRAVYDAVLR